MTNEPRRFNLDQLHADETPLARYRRLTVGENTSWAALMAHELVFGLCYWMPGLAGAAIRRLLYPLAFRGLGRRSFVGHHVTLRCPRQIELGAGVVLDDYVLLAANTRAPRGIGIGDGSFVRSFASINAGPPEGFVRIGAHSGIGQGTVLYGNGGLVIGDHVMIAGQCFVVASSHVFDDPEQPIARQGYEALGITIEDNVWIGAGAKILDGVTIGKGAIVAANAVVNRSVPAGARVGGIPARPLVSRGTKE